MYNIGGGRENSTSVLEAFDRIRQITGKTVKWEYRDEPRKGDHVCYISDLRKFRENFPNWGLTRNLDQIIVESLRLRRSSLVMRGRTEAAC